MITLHELHQRGGDTAKAVIAFGTLHQEATLTSQGHATDWKAAERHFLDIQILLMEHPAAPPGARALEQERRAENAATDLLLAINPGAGHRCPMCQRSTTNV
ncbi:hypothetical protein [Streptomyces sp. NPDC006645]|uniref:hypothetical protein n=1 Tax=unclassified Streptomyces TaxID=2593676 RepID=UPI0033B727C9